MARVLADLADAFARHVVTPPDLLECARWTTVEAEPEADDLLLAVVEVVERVEHGLTQHAAGRGVGGPPAPGSTNLHLAAGTETPEAMIGAIKDGLYVTDMIGSGVNMVTGDYSRGCSGFWIENGELAFPVAEITIAGNLVDMFLNLTPANDLTFKYGTNAPTVLVEGLTIAGR